jgi:hypothetical protein
VFSSCLGLPVSCELYASIHDETNFELHLTLELLYFYLDYGGNWEVSSADAMNLTCWHLDVRGLSFELY